MFFPNSGLLLITCSEQICPMQLKSFVILLHIIVHYATFQRKYSHRNDLYKLPMQISPNSYISKSKFGNSLSCEEFVRYAMHASVCFCSAQSVVSPHITKIF